MYFVLLNIKLLYVYKMSFVYCWGVNKMSLYNCEYVVIVKSDMYNMMLCMIVVKKMYNS